ncbi:MAG: DUF169 domain-containing protein [Methanomicrobiales archaeon]|nr:DUF169 domain-containing protein [Methanomicrobiales archaeon]
MEDVIRTKIDYPKVANTIKELLNLDGSPVAVKFIKSEDHLPDGVKNIGETIQHCQMVNRARRDGAIFYATKDNHACMGGAYALGLREITPTLKSGEFYYKLGKYDSWPSCKRTIDRIPHLESGTTYATAYAPLEKTPFDPTIVLIVSTPKVMLKLAQSSLYHLGGRINSNFAGIQSVCADASAQVYLSGTVNFSLGCDGSRKFSGIQEGEMVMGIPAEMLPQIIEALPVVVGAPGSS